MTTPADAKARWRSGVDLFNQGKYELAAQEFQASTELDPTDANAWNEWGVTLIRLKKQADAVPKLQKAIELARAQANGQFPEAHNNLGVALAAIEQFDAAVEEYREATAIKPQYAVAYRNWGNALFRRKEYPEAADKYERAAKADPEHADPLAAWGDALFMQKDYRDAVDKYLQAARIDSQSISFANWARAFLELPENEREGVAGQFQTAVEGNKGAPEAYANWGRSLYDLERFAEAADRYAKAASLDDKLVRAWNGWGDALLGLHKYSDAAGRYERTTVIDPGNAPAWKAWGYALQMQKKYEEAAERYRRASEIDPKDADARGRWGDALVAQAKYGDAAEKYEQATAINPENAPAWKAWGYALQMQNMPHAWAQAAEKYRRAAEIDPKDAAAYFGWGSSLHEIKRYDEAFEKLGKAAACSPDWPYPFHQMGSYFSKQGRYPETWDNARHAVGLYEKGQEEAARSGDSDFFQYYGDLLRGLYLELDQAERAYRKGLQCDAKHIGCLMGLVRVCLMEQERHPAKSAAYHWSARENFAKAEQVLKQQLEDPVARLRLGRLHLLLENYSEAEEHLLRALQSNRRWPDALISMGLLRARGGDFLKAASYFEDALRWDPDNLDVLNSLAECCLRSKQTDKAEDTYQKVLAIAPDCVEAHWGLGELNITRAELGDEDLFEIAIEEFERAIELSETRRASKKLTPKEMAAIQYAMGYAYVGLYNAQAKKDEGLLSQAQEAFGKCKDDPRAKRAIEKIKKRLTSSTPEQRAEKWGAPIVGAMSLAIFAAAQYSFFRGGKVNELGYYVLLSFGSLVCAIAALSLPRLLKLKVAGVELERSAAEQISTAAFKIGRSEFSSSLAAGAAGPGLGADTQAPPSQPKDQEALS